MIGDGSSSEAEAVASSAAPTVRGVSWTTANLPTFPLARSIGTGILLSFRAGAAVRSQGLRAAVDAVSLASVYSRGWSKSDGLRLGIPHDPGPACRRARNPRGEIWSSAVESRAGEARLEPVGKVTVGEAVVQRDRLRRREGGRDPVAELSLILGFVGDRRGIAWRRRSRVEDARHLRGLRDGSGVSADASRGLPRVLRDVDRGRFLVLAFGHPVQPWSDRSPACAGQECEKTPLDLRVAFLLQ